MSIEGDKFLLGETENNLFCIFSHYITHEHSISADTYDNKDLSTVAQFHLAKSITE